MNEKELNEEKEKLKEVITKLNDEEVSLEENLEASTKRICKR